MLLTAWHFLPLQLGHARPRVETHGWRWRGAAGCGLQLGHARPRVETSPQIEERTAMERFNWATRVRAWKLTIPDSTKLPLKSFNWATRVRAWKLCAPLW